MKKIVSVIVTVLAMASSAFGFTYAHEAAGFIKGARLSYNSTSSIKLGVGYGDLQGDYWEIGPTDALVTTGYTLTGLTSTTNGEVEYIYIDGTNSVLPSVTLKNSTTAPTWSDTYMAWYNGVDRCIGAVWIIPTGTILNFYCSADDEYHYTANVNVATGTSVSSSYPVWTNVDLTNYLPINTRAVRFETAISWNGSGTAWTAAVSGISTQTGTTTNDFNFANGSTTAYAIDWLGYSRGTTKPAQYLTFASNNTTNANFAVIVIGYRLER